MSSYLPMSLNFLQAAVILLALTILYRILRVTYNIFFHPLSRFPGPKLWAATRLVYVYYQFRGVLIFRVKELHDRYGPTVRIAPDELAFTDVSAWKDIYGGTDQKQHPRDPYIFPPNGPKLPNSIVHANDSEHARIRKQVSYGFSAKALEDQQSLISGHVDTMMTQLRERKGPFDLANWFNFIAFDIVGDLAFGQSFECVENGAYHPWASFSLAAFKAAIFMSALNRYGLLKFTVLLLPRSLTAAHDKFIGYAKQTVAKRLERTTDRPDFITYMQRADKNDRTMAVGEIESTTLTFIIAGSESTGSLLTGTVYYLLKDSTRLSKLVHEIRSAISAESEINAKSVAKLPYMLACLDEGMRISTPAPFGLARRTTEPTMVAGELVPKGTSVSVWQWAAWHSESNFNKADEYLPERWMEKERSAEDKGTKGFHPFSVGPRNCIGKNLSYLEQRLVLARLLWNFDLELADQSYKWTEQKAYIVWDKKPFMVNLTPVRR